MLRIVARKPLMWLRGEIKTPPFSAAARAEAGYLLRMLQEGERLGMPQSRPMPQIGSSCCELRIVDADVTWRIVCGLTSDAVVILDVFEKKSRTTPKQVLRNSSRRWRKYLKDSEEN